MKRALLALLLCGCTSTLSLVPRRVELTAPRVELPLTFLHDVPLVEVSIDHRPLGNFLLDLGASGAILSERVAKELHAPSRHGVTEIRDAAGKVSTVDRKVMRVRLATRGATFVGTNAIVVDLEPFSRATGVPIDGILGWSMFANVTLELDYAAHRAALSHEGLPQPDGDQVLALHDLDGVPAIDLDVDHASRRVMVDTGAMCAFAFPASWSKTLTTVGGWMPGRASRNLFGISRSPIGRLASDLHIGRYVLAQPIVEQSPSEVARVGALVLRAFTLTFDAKRGRVRFHALERQLELPAWKSLGVSLEKTSDGWVVYDVVPASPAASLDIKVGDAITAVDGAPVASWTIDAWFHAIESRPALDVTVRRSGRTFPLTLPVFDLPP